MNSKGAVLPGVTVTTVCTDTNLSRASVSDSQGAFRFPELPICLYRVTSLACGDLVQLPVAA